MRGQGATVEIRQRRRRRRVQLARQHAVVEDTATAIRGRAQGVTAWIAQREPPWETPSAPASGGNTPRRGRPQRSSSEPHGGSPKSDPAPPRGWPDAKYALDSLDRRAVRADVSPPARGIAIDIEPGDFTPMFELHRLRSAPAPTPYRARAAGGRVPFERAALARHVDQMRRSGSECRPAIDPKRWPRKTKKQPHRRPARRRGTARASRRARRFRRRHHDQLVAVGSAADGGARRGPALRQPFHDDDHLVEEFA